MQVVLLMGFKWYGRSYQQVLGRAVPECFATRGIRRYRNPWKYYSVVKKKWNMNDWYKTQLCEELNPQISTWISEWSSLREIRLVRHDWMVVEWHLFLTGTNNTHMSESMDSRIPLFSFSLLFFSFFFKQWPPLFRHPDRRSDRSVSLCAFWSLKK